VNRQKSAIVIGASLAGLCAARVLARHFDKVTLVERDELPTSAAARAGVPQSRHVHALVSRGAFELDRLFPGFLAEYEAKGALRLDVPYDGAVLRVPGWQKPFASGTDVFFATRDLTESIVRDRVRALENVNILDRTDVIDFLLEGSDPRRIAGVLASRRDGGEHLSLKADFVVDASGRTSKTPAFLSAHGLPVAREEVVDCFSGYSSRWYEMPEAWPADHWWKLVWLDPSPPDQLMGGVLFPVEGRRFIVTLIGYSKHYPPNDETEFFEALTKLRSPLIARMVEKSKPISGIHASRALKNRLRRYDEQKEPAPGFVALGDSVCTFNPMYGQGMTVTTLSAKALEDTLLRVDLRDPAFERMFYASQYGSMKDAWRLATSADMRFPGVQSDLKAPDAFSRFVSRSILHALIVDPEVVRRASPIFYMLKPTKTLFEKDLFARILAHGIVGEAKQRFFPSPPSSFPPPRL